jgi:NitT/TauT family transport system permease protein
MNGGMKRAADILLCVAVAVLLLGLWQWKVVHDAIPAYVLPAPSAVAVALAQNFSSLMASLWTTLAVTLLAFVCATAAALALAILFSESRVAARILYPYAVILQVTPVVAIAPLILLWIGYGRVTAAETLIAAIVAFFPVLSNTTLGLRSADPGLIDLMRLYGARRWQAVWRVRLPTALPYLLAGMKTAGGLALIGTVVAEFVAGSGAATGLAWRIVESGNRLEIATMFAALTLLALVGIAIFFALSGLEYLLLRRWHESALRPF